MLALRALGIDRVALLRDDPGIDGERAGYLLDLYGRRARHEPLDYILGFADFYGLSLRVGPGVLVPRPETELLVELSLRLIRNTETPRICELGAGSACISLALAHARPDAVITAVENSPRALDYARLNIESSSLENIELRNVDFMKEEITGPGRFDLLVSNPPYIPSEEIDTLSPEVSVHEPREALDGGPDGLEAYRRIIALASTDGLLRPGGWLALEIGHGQRGAIERLLEKAGFSDIIFERDLAGLERLMAATSGAQEEK